MDLLSAFQVSKSTFSYYKKALNQRNTDLEALKQRIQSIAKASRYSAGSRTICFTLRNEGIILSRYKVRQIMSDLKIVSQQLKPKRFKSAQANRPMSKII